MVYKKFIKKDGRTYGPYIYHSRRVNGKVVSEYHGSEGKKSYLKIFLVFAAIFLILGFFYFGFKIFNSQGLTGLVTLNAQGTYFSNQSLQSTVDFSLKKGEFLPASSKIVVQSPSGTTYTYTLSDVVSNSVLNGSFYIEGNSLSGEGEGYGVQGEKTIYLPVAFILDIYNVTNVQESSTSEENTSNTNETSSSENSNVSQSETPSDNSSSSTSSSSESPAEVSTPPSSESPTTDNSVTTTPETTTSTSETTPSETTTSTEASITTTDTSSEKSKEKEEKVKEESKTTSTPETTTASEATSSESAASETTSEAPVTGNVVSQGNFVSNFFGGIFNFFRGLIISGRAVQDNVLNEEVEGVIGSDGTWSYQISDGQTADLKSGSVSYDGSSVDDSYLSVSVNGKDVLVESNYTIVQNGYGENYVQDETGEELIINLTELDIPSEKGEFKISLVYGDNEIVNGYLNLSEEGVSVSTTNVTEIQNQTEVNITNASVFKSEIVLTDEELNALKNKFGENFTLNIANATALNGRIVLRYELGNYWVEFSYKGDSSTDLNERDLTRDRIKWMKDLADSIIEDGKGDESVELDNLIGDVAVESNSSS
ncbi:MAG: hypothetical protein Q7S56_02810 [Nanoarchaeota archaeon]|nr:hypothetical protein [Nanoarchaeota archaeon]